MKPNTIFSILIAAALLPGFAHAGMDNISGSSGPGIHCDLTSTTIVAADTAMKTDPMETAISAMVDGTDDPVLASYYRDLYRESVSSPTEQFVRAPDPYADAVALALYGTFEQDPRLVC